MATVRALVTMQGTSGEAKDRYVNTWHFTVADASEGSADYTDLFDALKNFYGQDTEQTSSQEPVGERNVFDYIGDHLEAGAVHTMKFYDLSNPPESPPVFSGTFNRSNTGQVMLPAEVAVVLSLKATVPNGSNVQRGRGRLYIGPLNERALGADSNDARVSQLMRQVLRKALIRLTTEISGTSELVVHSAGARGIDPATGKRKTGQLLAAEDFPVTAAFIDDAFDTQRRRGNASTTRTTVTL